jgi:ABC transporter DrrB family efflux protein
LAFARADLLVLSRSPERLALASVQPVLILLFLVVLLSGSVQVPGGNYIGFLLPGVILQSVLLVSATTASSIAFARQSGTLRRYQVLPISLTSYFLGRAVSECIITVLATGLLMIVGAVIGWRPSTDLGSASLAVLIVLMVSLTSTLMGITVGLRVAGPESSAQVAMILTTPPAFLSTMMVTQEALPAWLQPVVQFNPVTSVLNLLRDALSGETAPALSRTWDGAYSISWMLVISTLALLLSTSRLRRLRTRVSGAK